MLSISAPLMIQGNLDTKESPGRLWASSKAILCTDYESLNWSKGSLWWQTDLNDPLRSTEAVELTNFLILQPTTSAEERDMRFLHFLPTQTQLMC